MNGIHVSEVMRLASLLATARCVRLKQKEKGPVEAAQAEVRVAKATEALRSYVQYVVDQIPTTEGEAP